MMISFHAIANGGWFDTQWVEKATLILNALQKDLIFSPGDSKAMPSLRRTAFGYDLDQVAGALDEADNLNHIILGTFEALGGKSLLIDEAMALCTAGHMLAHKPGYSADSVLLHLAISAGLRLKATTISCNDPKCVFHTPNKGWPLFASICVNCHTKMSSFGIDGLSINTALNFLYDHREPAETLETMARDAYALFSPKEVDGAIAELQADIEVLARRFSARPINSKTIENWLRQIAVPGEIRLACTLLHAITFVTHEHFIDVFQELLGGLPDSHQYVGAPFGKPDDSSSMLNYTIGRLPLPVKNIVTLNEALAGIKAGKYEPKLIFFDDALFSGKQAHIVFRQYFGLPAESRKGEPYVQALSREEKHTLSECDIVFACAFAHRTGIHRIENISWNKRKLKISVLYASELTDSSKAFHPTKCIFRTPADRIKAMNMARRIGMELHLSGKPMLKDITREKAYSHALGSFDMQQLIVYPYSTPKLTLTFLWKSGTYGGKSWLPLFPPQQE